MKRHFREIQSYGPRREANERGVYIKLVTISSISCLHLFRPTFISIIR